MGTFTLGTPILLASGCQMTFNVAAGTCNGTVTTDPTKISIALTSEGYNSSGVLGTIARTITIVSATVSGATLTCNLSEPIYNDDTAVSVTLQAAAFTDVTPDTSAALGSTSVDIATTPSTLDYPKVVAEWIFRNGHAPDQRKTTAWKEHVEANHRHGIACVTIGVTEAVYVTGTLGGASNFTYRESVTTPGGFAGIVAPCKGTSESQPGSAGNMWFFPTAGTVANTDVISGATRTLTATANGTGGATKSTTESARSATTRRGSYGAATTYDLFEATFDPSNWDGGGTDAAYGPARAWFIAYPVVGDADSILDSRNFTTTTKYAETRFLDPSNTLGANAKTIYIDSTSTAAADTYSGTFTDREFAKVTTAGSLSAVVRIIGGQSATPVRYCGANGWSAKYVTTTLGGSGTPVYGDFVQNSAGTQQGIVLEYSGGVLYYIALVSTIATGQTLGFFSSGGADQENVVRSYTGTTTSGSTTVGTTVTSGDVVTGYSSGASCTLTGAPAASGSDSNAGTTAGAPVATLMVALNKAKQTTGDASGLGDGATIKLLAGDYDIGVYAFGNRVETRWYAPTIQPNDGLSIGDCRIIRSQANGLNNNQLRLYGLMIEALTTNPVGNATTLANIIGVYDRRVLHIDSCIMAGWCRIHNIQLWYASGAWDLAIMDNCYSRNASSALQGTHVADCESKHIGSDCVTNGRGVANVKLSDLDATDSAFHADVAQYAGGTDNAVVCYLDAIDRPSGQGPWFSNASTGTVQNISMRMVRCDPDPTAQVAQIGNGTFRNIIFDNVTFGDGLALNGSSSALTLDRIGFRKCYFSSLTQTGTVNDLYQAYFDNCHFLSGTAYGINATSGSTLGALFVDSSDPTAAGYYVPKASSVLLNRAAITNLGGAYDAVGRLLSTDNAAKAAIGGMQPIPVLTVTYDGDSVSDGGTVTEGTGSRDLVMTVGGPTGAVAYISDVAMGGTVSGTDASPYSLASGGTTASATITTTLTAGAATVDISWDLSSVFDFDITGTSPAGSGGFRARSRGRGR